MKLFEQIRRINSIIDHDLITEASKMKILTDKIGLSQENAEILDRLCGSLSVWMANKVIDYYKKTLETFGNNTNPVSFINEKGLKYTEEMTSIMDWVRVGLNGDIKNIKENSFKELIEQSKQWHDSLGVGEGQINYVETGDIVKDFRDNDGEGFYWVNTKTHSCPEEAKRMGHCGRTGRWNTIYSLRSYKKLGPKFTLNKSHLTAAISDDGILYQLKGPKNSKPKPELHNYILELFYILNEGGEQFDYLIKGFGTEYASEADFKLSDLPDDVIVELYRDRPELFDSRKLQRKLMELGIIEEVKLDYNITVRCDPSYLDRYIGGSWITNRRKVKKTSPAGVEYESYVETNIFETILSGDMWDLWDNAEYVDWHVYLDYDCDEENAKTIEDMVRTWAEENSDFDEEEFNEMTLNNKIKEYDDDHKIRWAIKNAVNAAQADDYYNYLYNSLEGAIQEYGEVIELNDEEIIFKVNIENYLDELSEEEYDDYMDRCNDELLCVFEEMCYNGIIDKPVFSVYDRYGPDVDTHYFNELLSDNLSEIQ